MSFPAFLFLLPLVTVPIIIHLMSRKKLKKIDFPSLLFIIKSEIKIIRWFRLKRLLLLIMRVSFIILLILAAAGLKIPFVFVTPSETLILDKSPSMEKILTEDDNTFIVPTNSGIPEFMQYLKNYPGGILITDAQRNGFREILKEREKFPGINIRKVAFPAGNLGIVGASSSPGYGDEKFNVNFKILNEYKEKKNPRLVLKIEGKIIREENVILNIGENVVSFDLILPKSLYQLSLELEDEEGFGFDNKFYFIVNVQKKKDICILSDVYPEHLMSALSPSYFDVKWVKEIADVKGDFFFACSASGKNELALLQSAVPGIFCLQGRTNTSISNKIPDRISTIAEGSYFDDSSLLKNLSEFPVKYNCLIVEGKTLMYFENGDPFLSKIKNHLILPISLEENDLSLHPVFVPFLFLMISSLSEEITHGNILLDEPIFIENLTQPQVITPGKDEYKPYRVGKNYYIFKETKECGVYKIRDGKEIIGLVAVNTPPSESRLESLSPEEIEYIFGKAGFSNGSTSFIVIALLCFIFSLFLERKM